MEKRYEIINGRKVELIYFQNPMSHDDWHVAEGLGCVYSGYCHHGPDYWDDELRFCKKEEKELVDNWIKENTW